MRHSCCLLIAVVVSNVIALPGCGAANYPTTDLKGTVTVNGIPVAKGGITFTPLTESHGKGVFAFVVEGQYEAKKVAVGGTRVFFTLVKETGRTMEVSKIKMPETVDLVPPKYQHGMDIEVHSGEARRDFELVSQ